MPAPVQINNRKDILLLLLHSPGETGSYNEPIAGRTRLVKMLFLFKKEALREFKRGTSINEENFYDFFAWNFGPFSSQVYDDLMFFILRGFISTTAIEDSPSPEAAAEWLLWLRNSSASEGTENSEFFEEQYYLTEVGGKFTSQLYSTLSTEQKNLLTSFKSRLNRAPLRAILKYVYSTYPDMTDKSTIKNDILGASA